MDKQMTTADDLAEIKREDDEFYAELKRTVLRTAVQMHLLADSDHVDIYAGSIADIQAWLDAERMTFNCPDDKAIPSLGIENVSMNGGTIFISLLSAGAADKDEAD